MEREELESWGTYHSTVACGAVCPGDGMRRGYCSMSSVQTSATATLMCLAMTFSGTVGSWHLRDLILAEEAKHHQHDHEAKEESHCLILAMDWHHSVHTASRSKTS